MLSTVQRLTAILVIAAPLVVISYDVIVSIVWGRTATITAVVQSWAHEYRDLPYVVAGLFVWLWLHLFFEIVIAHR